MFIGTPRVRSEPESPPRVPTNAPPPMKKHLPTIIILAVVVPMAGLLGWFVLRARSAETSARPAAERAAIAVEVRTVESGMLRDVRKFTGTLE